MNVSTPVVLFVYNRADHLKQTLKALNNNRLISKTTLYIFSDGPRCEADTDGVRKVRDLIRRKNGFRTTEILESETNMGLAASVIGGVTKVFDQHGEAVVLEDDVITSPGWYEFMNGGINFYRENSNIWSIGGYCPPIEFPTHYQSDVFLSPLATSYSWGTWGDRWKDIDWDVVDFNDFIRDTDRVRRFCGWNPARLRLLRRTLRNNRSSWAIRWEYAAAKHNCVNLLPTRSRVTNIGYDKGEHSQLRGAKKASSKYSVVPTDQPVEFRDDIRMESEIVSALASFYHVPFHQRARYLAGKMLDRLGIIR